MSPEDSLLGSSRYAASNSHSLAYDLGPPGQYHTSHFYNGPNEGSGIHRKTNFIEHDAFAREPSPQLLEKAAYGPSSRWKTKWLHKVTLFAFALLYLAFAGALIGVWLNNNDQDGFSTTLSNNHYSWTYGPTAILVIVLSLWRQVDYYSKLTQPWQILQGGAPVAATKSVLLDYVSPLQLTSFWRAVGSRHVPVAASVAGFGILKLVILASTGLLVLTPTPVSMTIPVTVTTKFDMDKVSAESFYAAVDDAPVQSYLGAITGELPFPAGTLDDKAFQQISYPTGRSISDLLVRLDVFVPKITCEIAEVESRKTLDPGTLDVQMDTPSCSVGHEDQDDMDLFGMMQNGRLRMTDSEEPQFFTYYDLWRVNCSGPQIATWGSELDNSTQDDIRHALMVSNISAWSQTGFNGSSGTITDQTAFDLSAVICKFDYSVESLEMMHNRQGNDVNASISDATKDDGTKLDGLSGVMLAEQIFASLMSAVSITFPDEDDDANHFASVPLFYLMTQTLQDDKSMARLLDPEELKDAAERVWNGLAAQVARQAYEAPAEIEAEGNGIYEEEKLRVGLVSLWLMVAGFVLMALLSIILAFTVCQNVVAEDPRTIASVAAMVASSPSIRAPFKGTGAMRRSQLTETIRNYAFQTSFRNGFVLEASPGQDASAPEVKVKEKPWGPFSTKYWMIGMMLISPLLVIAVLEVLQRVSDNNQGIADVTGSEDVAEYVSHYLSAFLMLLLATSINNFDSTITSFAPYSILRSGAAPASRSVDFILLGELAPVALFKSVAKRHFSSAFSNIGGIVGSVLTIVVSGLWTVDHSSLGTTDVSIPSANSFDVAWPRSSTDDSGGAELFNHIQHGSASIPTNVWENLVFPKVAEQWSSAEPRNFTLTVEALRPVLTCEVAADERIEIEFFTDEDEHDWLTLRALPTLPDDCQRGGSSGTSSYANFSKRIEYYDFYDGYWNGAFWDLHVGPWDSDSNSTFVEAGESIPPNPLQPDNPQGCPSVAVLWATTRGNATTADDVMGLICSQKIQSVMVNAIFDGSVDPPTLLKSPPPVPDESTATFLTNGTSGLESFPYRFQPHIDTDFTKFPGLNTDAEAASPLLNHLLYGPRGIPEADLLGRENRQAFIDGISDLYARYMVHVIDLHFRQATTAATAANTSPSVVDPAAFTGTASTTRSRLKVNSGSKIALQAMLGAIALLGALAFATSDLRGTLPREPLSIASVVGFVVGSEVMKDGVRGSGGERNRGYLYSLGWWSTATRASEMQVRTADGWEDSNAELLDGRGTAEDERRFGVDVGMPEELGYRRTRWWEIRRRIAVRGVNR